MTIKVEFLQQQKSLQTISFTVEDADLLEGGVGGGGGGGLRAFLLQISSSSHGREPKEAEGWITG